jgi:hypothetical protein
LMNNNNEYINYYKDPSTKHYTTANKIENTQQRTKDKLNDLIEVGLIDIVGSTKVQKGNATTPLYQYNGSGYFLAWLIESFDPNKREMANNEIYNLFDSNFKALVSPSSYSIFNAALYKKYKEKGVFGSFVVDPLRERLDSNSQTRDIQELFHRIGVLYVDDDDQSEFFRDLWHEALNELDAKTRDLVLHNIKLEIERRMEAKAQDLSKFEQARFLIKHKHDTVALEGYCDRCNTRYPIAIGLEGYLYIANFIPSKPVKAECYLCKGKNCYTINLIEY